MPTYVYETIPQKDGELPRRFEVKQSMYDAPLKSHPGTGEPVQRVITGSVGIIAHSSGGASSHSHQHAEYQECCGGHGGPNCHCQCSNN